MLEVVSLSRQVNTILALARLYIAVVRLITLRWASVLRYQEWVSRIAAINSVMNVNLEFAQSQRRKRRNLLEELAVLGGRVRLLR